MKIDLRTALEAILKDYVDMVSSGDAGTWEPETETNVINARAALAAEPSITINPSHWTEAGNDESEDKATRLITMIRVNDTHMHLEAYAVAEDTAKGQHFEDDTYFEAGEHAFYAFTGGACQTTIINDREYVLVATPHGA